MKPSVIKILIVSAAVMFAGTGTAGAQPAHARQDSRNNNNSHFRQNSGPGKVYVPNNNRHVSYSYRPRVVVAPSIPYRYDYFVSPYSPYYTTAYWPYSGNYGYATYSGADSPGYALGGAVLGGVLGGIIGNNSGSRNTWAGAAIGSAIGYLAGNAADHAAVRQQRAGRDTAQTAANNAGFAHATHVAQPGTPPPPPPPSPAPQQPRRVAEPSAAAPMSQANALFGRQ